MKEAISLLMLLAIALAASHFAGAWSTEADAGLTRTAMSVGLLMLGAWLAGQLFDRINLPKISGYLLYGCLVGPFALGLISTDHAKYDLAFISDLAVALIALTAGGEIKLQWLRGQFGKVASITGIEMITVWAVVGTAVYMVEPYVPLFTAEDGDVLVTEQKRIVLAVLVGLVAAANSPAVVIAMITEFRATGPISRTTLAVTIFKDMLMVVIFATALAIGRGVASPEVPLDAGFLLAVGIQLIGSLALGAVLGVLMAWYVHRVEAHLVIFVIGACMLFAVLGDQTFTVLGGSTTHLEPLLMGLAAGVTMQNIWPKESEPLFESIERASLPVYCLFFALAGAKIELDKLATVWAASMVFGLAILRALSIWGSVSVASKLVGLAPDVRKRMWLGFIPQAGIALALAQLIQNAFPDKYDVNVENVMIGMIAINELLGPIGFRYALLPERQTGGKASVSTSTH